MVEYMLEINEIRFLDLRDKLYNIFIMNLDVTEFVWAIFTSQQTKENSIRQSFRMFSQDLLILTTI